MSSLQECSSRMVNASLTMFGTPARPAPASQVDGAASPLERIQPSRPLPQPGPAQIELLQVPQFGQSIWQFGEAVGAEVEMDQVGQPANACGDFRDRVVAQV